MTSPHGRPPPATRSAALARARDLEVTWIDTHFAVPAAARAQIDDLIAYLNGSASPGMTAASPRALGSATGGPPPAWHPNPEDPGTWRWWDGARWTSFTCPSPAPARTWFPSRARCRHRGVRSAESEGEGRRHRAGRLRGRRAHEHWCGARRDRARRRGALGGHVGGRRLRVVGRAARHVPRGGAPSRIGIAARPRPGRHPPVRPRHGRRRVDRRGAWWARQSPRR